MRLSARAVAWRESEIDQWIAARTGRAIGPRSGDHEPEQARIPAASQATKAVPPPSGGGAFVARPVETGVLSELLPRASSKDEDRRSACRARVPKKQPSRLADRGWASGNWPRNLGTGGDAVKSEFRARASPHQSRPHPRSGRSGGPVGASQRRGRKRLPDRQGCRRMDCASRMTAACWCLCATRAASCATCKRSQRGKALRGPKWAVARCGTPEGAPVLAVCEGYATAASVHQATGRPTAVAFDAGNLANVAKTLRKLYPAVLVVIAGDDDRATEARTGSNPGRLKAEAAARAVHGLAVFPAPLPENGSDFNDLHQGEGLDAVRDCIEGAIEAHQACASAAHAAQTDRQGNPRHGPRHAPHDGGNDAHDTGRAFDRFHVDDEGVWFTPPGDDGGMPRKVCGPLRVTGPATATTTRRHCCWSSIRPSGLGGAG
ncbi:MAG: toprim domain-containing protein [Betaproteobacteria bacterium]|nr:toprim domain-containing protein [Betaproteobacteria bacterium]